MRLASRWRRWAADREIACRASRRSEEHTSELQSRENLVCRLPLEKKTSARADRPAAAREERRAVRRLICCRIDSANIGRYSLSLHDALPILSQRRQRENLVSRLLA